MDGKITLEELVAMGVKSGQDGGVGEALWASEPCQMTELMIAASGRHVLDVVLLFTRLAGKDEWEHTGLSPGALDADIEILSSALDVCNEQGMDTEVASEIQTGIRHALRFLCLCTKQAPPVWRPPLVQSSKDAEQQQQQQQVHQNEAHQIERQIEAQIEQQREAEIERQKEEAEERQREEIERQNEAQIEQQREAEIERQKEEMERQKEAEIKRQKEEAEERKKEAEEREKEAEMERQKEEMERQREEAEERKKEAEERKKEAEERQKEMERQKKEAEERQKKEAEERQKKEAEEQQREEMERQKEEAAHQRRQEQEEAARQRRREQEAEAEARRLEERVQRKVELEVQRRLQHQPDPEENSREIEDLMRTIAMLQNEIRLKDNAMATMEAEHALAILDLKRNPPPPEPKPEPQQQQDPRIPVLEKQLAVAQADVAKYQDVIQTLLAELQTSSDEMDALLEQNNALRQAAISLQASKTRVEQALAEAHSLNTSLIQTNSLVVKETNAVLHNVLSTSPSTSRSSTSTRLPTTRLPSTIVTPQPRPHRPLLPDII